MEHDERCYFLAGVLAVAIRHPEQHGRNLLRAGQSGVFDSALLLDSRRNSIACDPSRLMVSFSPRIFCLRTLSLEFAGGWYTCEVQALSSHMIACIKTMPCLEDDLTEAYLHRSTFHARIKHPRSSDANVEVTATASQRKQELTE